MRWYIYQVLWLWCFYGEEHEIHNYTKIHVIYKGAFLWGDLDQDHSGRGASKEPMNQCLEWINWFL